MVQNSEIRKLKSYKSYVKGLLMCVAILLPLKKNLHGSTMNFKGLAKPDLHLLRLMCPEHMEIKHCMISSPLKCVQIHLESIWI